MLKLLITLVGLGLTTLALTVPLEALSRSSCPAGCTCGCTAGGPCCCE